jgi:hypothetical protein
MKWYKNAASVLLVKLKSVGCKACATLVHYSETTAALLKRRLNKYSLRGGAHSQDVPHLLTVPALMQLAN